MWCELNVKYIHIFFHDIALDYIPNTVGAFIKRTATTLGPLNLHIVEEIPPSNSDQVRMVPMGCGGWFCKMGS